MTVLGLLAWNGASRVGTPHVKQSFNIILSL